MSSEAGIAWMNGMMFDGYDKLVEAAGHLNPSEVLVVTQKEGEGIFRSYGTPTPADTKYNKSLISSLITGAFIAGRFRGVGWKVFKVTSGGEIIEINKIGK